jgi:hypothetical protein
VRLLEEMGPALPHPYTSGVEGSAFSHMSQTDMYVSTLRSYIEAMGGELEIVARFGDKAVKLSQFEDLDREHAERRP